MHSSTRSPAPRLLSLPAALLGCCILTSAGLSASPALAQQAQQATAGPVPSHFYDLPAAPLAATLKAIAAASGRQVAFNEADLAAVRAAPVKGNFSAGAAVSQALAGTGLSLNEDGAGTLVVMPAPAVVITATRDQAETSFKADRSDTATRSGSKLQDVPGSVTIITSKVIESQQLSTIQDALRNVSGIKLTQSPQSVPTYQVRGFGSTATSNGVVDSNAAATNVFGVERVEVLKGPQAILAGSNALGGGVNVVLKKPQAETIRDLTLQYGSGSDKTAAADLSGALTEDKQLSYRLVGSMSAADRNDAGYKGREDNYILPELRWKDARTDLIVGLSYGNQFSPLYGATFARRDGVILQAPNILLANRADGFDMQQKKAFYQLEQVVNPQITVISRMQRNLDSLMLHVYSPGGLSYASGALPSSPRSTMSFYNSRSQTDSATTSGDHYVRASFNTWGVRHRLSVGVNHSDYSYTQTMWSGASVTAAPYSGVQAVFPEVLSSANTLSAISTYGQKQKAVFVQELVSVGNWDILLNGRRTLYKLEDGLTNYVSSNFLWPTPGRTIGANTPGGGVVYKVTPDVSVYASYSEGFVPQTTIQCGGSNPVPPIETKNKEAGAKFDLLQDRLMLTTSAFSLKQSNQLQYDSINRCYNVRDSQETRGVEADLQGRLAKGWDIIANYAYNTIRDVGVASTVYPGVPKHKFSLWTTYAFDYPGLQGFGAGFGISATSKAPGSYDTVYPFTQPGQSQLDANLSWQRTGWNVILGVKNLGDRVLYGGSGSNSFIPLLPGRQYMLTVKRSFQ